MMSHYFSNYDIINDVYRLFKTNLQRSQQLQVCLLKMDPEIAIATLNAVSFFFTSNLDKNPL